MNERIKELAERANAWYPLGYPSGEGGDEEWQNLVIFQKEDLQKFAELIVRECAEVARYYYTRNECVSPTQLKEHFGVEE
jgi:hypothetical protein